MSKGKPPLALANHPFTPMMNKKAPQAESPFELLKLGDLATPKINKSSSGSIHADEILLKDDPIDNINVEVESNQSISEIKKLLLAAIEKLNSLEKSQKIVKKKLVNVSTQVSDSPTEQLGKKIKTEKKASPNPGRVQIVETEEEIPKKRKSNVKQEAKPEKKTHLPVHSRNDIKSISSEESTEVRISKGKSRNFISGSGNSSSDPMFSDSGSQGLQERMHQMSIMLKDLEIRLDGIDLGKKY